MRILQLLDSLDSGDAVSNDCLALEECFRELGYQSELFVRYLNSPDLRPLARPIEEFDGGPEDVALLHFCGWAGVLREYLNFPGVRMLKYHGITPPEFFLDTPGMKGLAQWCYEGFAQLRRIAGAVHLGIGDSTFDANELAEYGCPRTEVVPIALSLAKIANAAFSGEVVRRYRDGDCINLLFVGRMAPNKRADDLLRLVKAYQDSCAANVRLFLVGTTAGVYAPFVAELRKLAAGLGLKEGKDFIITGKVTDEELYGFYRVANAFVSMSEHEGFCVPIVEAVALGVPTFGFASTAVTETMGNGGGLFDVKDFPELAKRIHTTITEPARRKELVRRQRERVQEFDLGVTSRKLERLLANLEGGEYGRPAPSLVAANVEVPISVVINTLNRARYLRRALSSLRRQNYRNFEVIVVNGPSVDETEAVLDSFPRVRRLHTSERNLAVSRNIGVRAARGDIVAFLDDDAIPARGWLAKLADRFADTQVGGAGGVVFSPGGKDAQFRNGTLDVRGGVVPIRDHPGQFNDPGGTEFNTTMGTNSAFRRTALYDIGLFDEEFAYYHDEADLSVRLIRMGWKVVHAPDASVVHDFALGANRATSQAYNLNWYQIVKNRVYFALKHRPAGIGLEAHIRAIEQDLYHDWFSTFSRWARQGEIDSSLHRKIMQDSIRGCWEGYRRAFNCQRPLREEMPLGSLQPYIQGEPPPLNICILSQDLPWTRPGGVADYSWKLARGLARLGQNVHLVTNTCQNGQEVRAGVHIHSGVPSTEDIGLQGRPAAESVLRYSLSAARKVRDLHETHPFDIIESPLWDTEGLALAMRPPARLVVRLQTSLAQVIASNGWEKSADLELCFDLERELLAKADGVIGISHHILEEIRTSHGFGSAALTDVIPIGIDPLDGPPLQRSDDKPHYGVLFVGRLERRKGIQELLQAISGIVAAVPNVSFSIVGRDGRPWGVPTEEHFRSALPPAVADCVTFYGELESTQLERMYASCDVFVAPSLYESFGIIFLEAMRYGKPVVGTEVGGIPEVVKDGATGLLVPAGDSDQLAAAVIRLLRDEDLRRSLGNAGYEAIQQHFSAELMCQRTLGFYRRLIEEAPDAEEIASPVHLTSAER